MSPALIAYRFGTRLLEPWVPRILDARVKQGKEDPVRVDERLGLTTVPRPAGLLVWLHGVSVGETLSLLPLIERIRAERPDLTLLVTSGTVTSAQVLAARLPPGVIHQFAPVDAPGAVDAFLDHWRPAMGVFVESELWPNLILTARRRGVRLALVSARITEKTAENWSRFPGAARRLLGAFSLVMPQDEASAMRLESIGAAPGGLVNLKLSGAPLPHDPAEFARLSAAIGDRPVVAVASTHAGEEEAVATALSGLPERPFLIIAPRHPDRSSEVAAALKAAGVRFTMRSRGDGPDPRADAWLADTLGEMGLVLRLADVVVMGGSFAPPLGREPVGGHNPLEPARLGKPAVSGPDVGNWEAVSRALADAGALTFVSAPSDLPGPVGALLADPEATRAMGDRARRAAADVGGGLDRLWTALAPLIPLARSAAR